MRSTIVGYAYFVPANPIVTKTTYNCTLAYTAAGDYNVTLGEGGADSTVCESAVTCQTAAAGGATSARVPSLIHTSDTVKRVQVRDDAGTLADPAGIWVIFRRLAPLA